MMGDDDGDAAGLDPSAGNGKNEEASNQVADSTDAAPHRESGTRPVTPTEAVVRPGIEREESSHEYRATGLDETPRSPIRKLTKPRKKKSGSGSELKSAMATDELQKKDATMLEEPSPPGDKSYAEALVEDPPETNGHSNGAHEVKQEKQEKHEDDDEEEYKPLPSDETIEKELEAREQERQNSYQAAGIRFAPFNVPVRRRLQTLAVLTHSLGIAILVSCFFFMCANPLMWPLIVPYLINLLFSSAATDGRLRFRSERLRHLRVWHFFADYFPATLHKTHDLPPTRKYILGYHPHGIISHGAWAAFATEALGFADKFPGITNSLLTLDSNFRIPLYRDYLLGMGLRSVSKESIGNILTTGGPNGEGMGRAVTIVVGGARESLEAHPGTLRLILQERKGFIRLAVRTGADIVPVLAFGENDLYDQIDPETHPTIRRVQQFALRTLKFTLPFLHGRGIFNYDVGLMPYRRPLNIVVGKPIRVTQAAASSVDPAEVDRLHDEYVAELEKIYHTYKDEFVPDRTDELEILK